ncbi:hypothetical protein [Halomicrococcus sp. NG-SE-24]|uniref:hypothetical protein n=1 Tax=Halomicrococcus sp. NG-SE-24 TaxID=3436928 RepID=UPI003D99AE64
MRRREVLKRTGAAVSVGLLGGCLDRYRSAPAGSDPDGGTDTTDDPGTGEGTSGTTDGDAPELTDRSLELVDAGCGDPDGRASVRFRRSAGTVVVDGTISADDPCHVARIVGTELDPKTGEFTVRVETEVRQTTGTTACVQCVGAIEYRATFAFDGGLPESVSVVHRGVDGATTVTMAESGTKTRSATTESETATGSATTE